MKSFDEKVDNAYTNICKVLGIQSVPTFEKKFLLEEVVKFEDVPAEHGPERFEEVKTFLNTTEEDHTSWVVSRKGESGSASLGYVDRTQKAGTTGIIELRRKVDPTLFGEYQNVRDPLRNDLKKNIIQIIANNTSFYIENFKNGEGKDVNLLRAFVVDENSKIDFPAFLKVGEEVTANADYKSVNLSLK